MECDLYDYISTRFSRTITNEGLYPETHCLSYNLERVLAEGSTAGSTDQEGAHGQEILHEETFDLDGDHEQKVSISYFHKLTLAKVAPIGSSILFRMTLVGGKTFKINALMFCSR